MNVIKTNYPRKLLTEIVESIKPKISCALIYGSYAINSGKKLTDESDIDFLLIFKPEVNPFPIIKEITAQFEKIKVPYDFGWFTQAHFIELLESKIDLCLWWSIFDYGEILYVEPAFKDQISNIIQKSDPVETFLPTVNWRLKKIQQLTQSISRNLHRLIIDTIWVRFYMTQGLCEWNDLPHYPELLRKALELNLIGNEENNLTGSIVRIKKSWKRNPRKFRFVTFNLFGKQQMQTS